MTEEADVLATHRTLGTVDPPVATATLIHLFHERHRTAHRDANLCSEVDAVFCPLTRTLRLDFSAWLSDESEPPWLPKRDTRAVIVANITEAVRRTCTEADAWHSTVACAAGHLPA